MATKKKATKPKKNSVESRLVDLTELDTPTILTIYGRGGTGKTTIATTAPKRQLFIDVKDHGTDSGKRKNLQKDEIKVFSLEHFDEIYDVYDYIMEDPEQWASVVIDHMTALQDFCYNKVQEDEGKSKMSQNMFGIASGYMKEVISLYKNLTDEGIIPIFIVQDREDGGDGQEDQLNPEVGPGLMPSIQRTLCAASRVIGHAYLAEKDNGGIEKKGDPEIQYRLRLGPDPFYITKVTRPPGTPCPNYLVDPTWDDIEQIISGEWEEVKKPRKKKGNVKRKLH